jgi:hypothetical protein
VDVPLPKNPYSSVKMEVYFDIIDLVGNYIMVNALKTPYEISLKNSNFFFNVHVKKIKLKSTQK